MVLRTWSRLTAALDRLHSAGLPRIRVIARRPAPPPAQPEPPLTGEALARQCLQAARDALATPGATSAVVFTKLRLLLNQLEQGGFRPAREATSTRVAEHAPPAEVPAPRPLANIRSLASHSVQALRRRSAVPPSAAALRRAA